MNPWAPSWSKAMFDCIRLYQNKSYEKVLVVNIPSFWVYKKNFHVKNFLPKTDKTWNCKVKDFHAQFFPDFNKVSGSFVHRSLSEGLSSEHTKVLRLANARFQFTRLLIRRNQGSLKQNISLSSKLGNAK